MSVSYTYARDHLATLYDKVVENHEIVIVERAGKPNMAMIAEDELERMLETFHLFSSPRNAARLISAINSAKNNEGVADSIDNLAHRFGLDMEDKAEEI